MGDKTELVRYTKADREAVFAFFRTVYPADKSARLIRQWDWKYDANPFSAEAPPYIMLLKDGPRIIGTFGGFALRFVIDGTVHWVGHGGDWIVDPEYRDRRLSRRLWEEHEAHRPLRFSWTNEFAFQRVHAIVKMETARLAPLVKPIDFTYMLHRVTGNRALSRVAGAVAEGLQSLADPLSRRSVAPGVTIGRIDTFDERFDALWQRCSRDYPVMLVRDRRYLHWRFIERPDATYTVLAATRDADLLGYLVVRSADKEDGRWGYLVDFLVRDRSPSVFSLLVGPGIEDLRREGVKAISCRAVVPPYRWPLYRHGFLPLRWGPRGYLEAYVNFWNPAYHVFGDVRRWFVTMGDGDVELDF